jgi:hypothetical protein
MGEAVAARGKKRQVLIKRLTAVKPEIVLNIRSKALLIQLSWCISA